jgi:hypothetical protein
MTIRSELMEVTGIKTKIGENKQAFLRRLVDATNDKKKVPDEAWEKLSAAAQNWVNDANKAIEDKTEIPDAGAAGAAEKAPAKKASKSASKTNGATKKAAAPKKAAGKKAKGKGNGAGRPRMSDEATVKRLVKEPPAGNRNEHWAKVPNGAKMGTIRKNKTLLRVTRYWRRKGFVELVAAKA